MNEENKRLPRCPARDEFAIIAMQERELQKERARRERAEKENNLIAWVSGLATTTIALLVILSIIRADAISAERAGACGRLFLGIGSVQFGTSMLLSVVRTTIRLIKEDRRKEGADDV